MKNAIALVAALSAFLFIFTAQANAAGSASGEAALLKDHPDATSGKAAQSEDEEADKLDEKEDADEGNNSMSKEDK